MRRRLIKQQHLSFLNLNVKKKKTKAAEGNKDNRLIIYIEHSKSERYYVKIDCKEHQEF